MAMMSSMPAPMMSLRMTQTLKSDLQVVEGPSALDPRARTEQSEERGALWLIPVPIGNLEDITLRAMRLLESVSLIACEDTRTTRQLLSLLNLTAPQFMSCHEHNERMQSGRILELLEAGKDVALVSDAGSPAISDPGARLVHIVIEAGYAVSALPGPCALTTALSASGLATDRFLFVGFLPSKGSARRKALGTYVHLPYTLICYESPHRLEKTLRDASELFGADRRAVIARELTKRFECYRRGSLGALCEDPGVIKGEIVLLIEGYNLKNPSSSEALEQLMIELKTLDLSPSAAAKWLRQRSSLSRQEAYDLLKSQTGQAKK